ncbi:MAG: pentapeptide repeat-containing protein [Anaerolineae bacterium]|nr:pentapeptide repeat-containing protein [Anaerolineae bacterium]
MLAAEFLQAAQPGNRILTKIAMQDEALPLLDCFDLTLRQCRFERVDFSGATLAGLHCIQCTFIDCDFTEADLPEARFEDTCFYRAATQCRFTRANLKLAAFVQCDLRMCEFERAMLARAEFDEVNAMGANFHLAQFENAARIVNSNFRYVDLTGANLERCVLSYTIFAQAIFQEAHLTGADLVGASLGGATWRYAMVTGANVRGADISSFDIRTMDLTGVKISERQQRVLLENAGVIIFLDE